MNEKNVPGFDLNLIRVFLAIWDLRSLTAAGERLHLTQPAISHALRRLRERFDDPLFVRAGSLMMPTDAAIQLHDPLERAYGLISHAVQDHGRFDAEATQRIFRVAMSDVSEIYFLPRLLARLEATAPLLRVNIVPLEIDNVRGLLRVGEVDMAIGHLPAIEDGCISHPLFTDRLVCLLRTGHPVAGRALTLESFAGLHHVHAGTSAPGHQMVDQCLRNLGLKRMVRVRVGHLTVAPDIVRTTDLAVIYPESLALRINQDGAFQLLPLPFDVPSVEVKAHVDAKFAGDPGVRWLLDSIRDVFAEMDLA
jgi:DNA-binding transcriptional LysR family regulator